MKQRLNEFISTTPFIIFNNRGGTAEKNNGNLFHFRVLSIIMAKGHESITNNTKNKQQLIIKE